MNEKGGLYFHIPFCKNRCPYCDFFSNKYCNTEAEEYCDSLIKKIMDYDGEFDTVYFGGGTPSIIKPRLIGEVLSAARRQFDIAPDSEITIECNPREDLAEAFGLYRSYGINRVSIGMQSAVDTERFALGRSAGKKEVERAVCDARAAGIENISLDLMLGIPNQSLESLDESLAFIEKMRVRHVSAYMLKIEKGTRFYEMRERLALPDEDEVSEMYLKTASVLGTLGLAQYEISNFAAPGYESRHNLKYWRLAPYLGIGKSAHSFWRGRRFYYDADFNLVDDGEGGTDSEKIMLGLRLAEGVEKALVKKPYEQFVKMGLMREDETHIALTPRGMLVSNVIINELI